MNDYDIDDVADYDPLHDVLREAGFADAFWDFSVPTIGDYAKLACPPSLPELY